MIAARALINVRGWSRTRAAVWAVCAALALVGPNLSPSGVFAAESQVNSRSPDLVRAMQKRACLVVDQLIPPLADKSLNRGGYVYECEALPTGEMFTLIGKLHVKGTGGPTQAQFLGTLKPTPGDGMEDWTLCTLSFNGAPVDLPAC
jgi:hypothetical protein